MFDRPAAGRAWSRRRSPITSISAAPTRSRSSSPVAPRRGTQRHPGVVRHRTGHPGHVGPHRDPLQVLRRQGLPQRRLRPAGRNDDQQPEKAHRFERRCARSRLKFTGSSDARLGPGRRRRGGCRLGPSRWPHTPVWDRGWRPDRPDGWREGRETLSLTERRRRHRYWSDAGIVRVRVMCVTITWGFVRSEAVGGHRGTLQRCRSWAGSSGTGWAMIA